VSVACEQTGTSRFAAINYGGQCLVDALLTSRNATLGSDWLKLLDDLIWINIFYFTLAV
jgi:hypothetical protein